LSLNTVNGRLITNDEISTLEAVSNGEFDNYITSVDESMFSVCDGKLELFNLPTYLFTPVVGDMTQLVNYSGTVTTVVDELNNIYNILTWNEMDTTK
jgi:hypothetical protein